MPLPRHVYVHVPFCARRCVYCDFAIAVRRDTPVREYIDALRTELDIRVGSNRGWEVDTLYLGGGTPSRLGADGLAEAVCMIRERMQLAPSAEVTIEANPDDVSVDAVRAWRAAGVTRLSIGSQSFDGAALAWMHRSHDAAAIPRAVAAAHAGGIENVSLDLIFALPDGVSRSWENDLARALALEPAHLSLYGLTVEPGTPLGRRAEQGTVCEAPDERYEVEFLRAHEAMATAGFEHYEVSNFARVGCHSRHNSSYWTGMPYLGLGPSAHGYDGVTRRWNVASYTEWVRCLAAGNDPLDDAETLTAANRVAEDVYLGLRTRHGLALGSTEQRLVDPWIQAGWGVVTEGRIRLTPLGWLRLDSLAAVLTDHRSR